MRIKELQERILTVLVVIGVVVIALLIHLIAASPNNALAGTQGTTVLTGFYNLLGYEGIGTLGSYGFTAGQTPPVGDYVTTHCRYIDVQNTDVGNYYLRYPLHLPNGATITGVSLFVADFNPAGNIWAYLRSRPWNSRNAGTTLDFVFTDNATDNDKSINMGTLNVAVDNETTEYWIDVSPQNSMSPGQLCVYGIQVIYTYKGVFLPLVRKSG
jgi:hypothetical protein